ncbi:MAG: hypothetical protein ACOYN6_15455 [Ignavibacteria bacterium]
MKKRILAVVLLISFFAVFSMSSEASAQSSPTLKVSVTKSVKPGGTGTLTIKFKHGNKVKIPQEPAIEVSISGDGITGSGSPTFSANDEGYITNSTIKYKFKVSGNATSGSTVQISGTVKFGYCSTETGTCKMGNQSFTTSVKIK